MSEFIFFVYLIFYSITGLCVGSFVNVIIYRLPLSLYMLYSESESNKKMTLFWPPSHCPQCHASILKRDNIPVISWLFLGGKCRFCKSGIPVIYPVTEFMHGIFFFFVFSLNYQYSGIWYIVSVSIFFCVLYSISLIDIKNFLIPDVLNYFLLWSGLLLSVSGITPVSPLSAVTGVCTIWFIMYSVMMAYERIRSKHGLGGGDVKLFAAVMPWIGIENIHYLILFSSVVGVVFMMLLRTNKGNEIISTPDCSAEYGSSYIPFGPAICVSSFFIFCFQ